jgi:hypothetical protein
MSFIYVPHSIVQKNVYVSPAPQGVKKTLFADQSARTSIYNRVSRAENTTRNSYGGYYVKNESPTNIINLSIGRVRGGGAAVPFKTRKIAPF